MTTPSPNRTPHRLPRLSKSRPGRVARSTPKVNGSGNSFPICDGRKTKQKTLDQYAHTSERKKRQELLSNRRLYKQETTSESGASFLFIFCFFSHQGVDPFRSRKSGSVTYRDTAPQGLVPVLTSHRARALRLALKYGDVLVSYVFSSAAVGPLRGPMPTLFPFPGIRPTTGGDVYAAERTRTDERCRRERERTVRNCRPEGATRHSVS